MYDCSRSRQEDKTLLEDQDISFNRRMCIFYRLGQKEILCSALAMLKSRLTSWPVVGGSIRSPPPQATDEGASMEVDRVPRVTAGRRRL